MLKNKIDFWQLVFYVSWSILAIWLILKVAGVFDTPVWLEYGIPIATAIVGVFGLYHKILERMNKLEIKIVVGLSTLTTKVNHIDKDVEILREDVGILKKKIV